MIFPWLKLVTPETTAPSAAVNGLAGRLFRRFLGGLNTAGQYQVPVIFSQKKNNWD